MGGSTSFYTLFVFLLHFQGSMYIFGTFCNNPTAPMLIYLVPALFQGPRALRILGLYLKQTEGRIIPQRIVKMYAAMWMYVWENFIS